MKNWAAATLSFRGLILRRTSETIPVLCFVPPLSDSDVKAPPPEAWGKKKIVDGLRSQRSVLRVELSCRNYPTLLGGFSSGTSLSIFKLLISGRAMTLFLCWSCH